MERYVRNGIITGYIISACDIFIPESPRWLIVTHKDEKAESVLSRIYRSTQVIREQISLTKSVLIEKIENLIGLYYGSQVF